MHWCTAPGFTLYLGDTHVFELAVKVLPLPRMTKRRRKRRKQRKRSEAYEDVSAALDAVHLQRLTLHQAAQVCALWSVLRMAQNL